VLHDEASVASHKAVWAFMSIANREAEDPAKAKVAANLRASTHLMAQDMNLSRALEQAIDEDDQESASILRLVKYRVILADRAMMLGRRGPAGLAVDAEVDVIKEARRMVVAHDEAAASALSELAMVLLRAMSRDLADPAFDPTAPNAVRRWSRYAVKDLAPEAQAVRRSVVYLLGHRPLAESLADAAGEHAYDLAVDKAREFAARRSDTVIDGRMRSVIAVLIEATDYCRAVARARIDG
jgi:hypothetical protein